MTINDRFESMKKTGVEVQKPLELLGQCNGKGVHIQYNIMSPRNWTGFDKE